MAGFEVYFGQAGVWSRVVLEGGVNEVQTILKNASDTFRPTLTDITTALTPRLLKVAADTLLATIADASTVLAGGSTAKPGSDIITPRITDLASIFNMPSIKVDTIRPTIAENSAVVITTSGTTTSAAYGRGLYGRGLYGQGSGTATTPDFEELDFEILDFNTTVV